jgi:beta-N-acetylhexosaminidase
MIRYYRAGSASREQTRTEDTRLPGLDINDLSMEQKIGQLLLARNPVDRRDYEAVLDLVRNRSLGGIHIAKRYVRADSYARNERELLERIVEAADYPILICEDMGDAAFESETEVSLPYQLAVGAAGSEELAYDYGKIIAIEARRKGYNLIFGPIFDIALNPQSCSVGARSFGGDSEIVARLGAAAVRGYQDHGVVVTAKHYPGFGESSVDSHIGMVYLHGDESLLLERELHPYLYAAKHADLSGIMTGHIMVPKVDPKLPASISPALIALLRRSGYDGLVVTDSFAMIGVTTLFPLHDCYRMAMQAGNDMVMASYRDPMADAYQVMVKAWRDGFVADDQVDAAARRVINAQNRTLTPPRQAEITSAEFAQADQIASGSIIAMLDGAAAASIDRAGEHLFIVQEGIVYRSPETQAIESESFDFSTFEETVRSRFPGSRIAHIPEFPSKSQIEHLLKTSLPFRSVVFVLGNKSASYTGSSDASKRMLAILDGLRPKVEAVVLFGNPYAAREFGRLKRLVLGFDGDACQRYAALTLAGEHEASGSLPLPFESVRPG